MGLRDIRDEIDTLDAELVKLLARRLKLVSSAAEHKHNRDGVRDPARVEAVVGRIREHGLACEADPMALEMIYYAIIDEGIKLEMAAYEQRVQQDPHYLAVSPDHTEAHAAVADLMNLMSTMRAMRRLDDRPVARDLLRKLIEAASWAPFGGNEQRYRFVIVTDKSQLERLAVPWAKAMEFHLKALRLPMWAEESQRFERVRAAMVYQRDNFSRVPALVVVCREPVRFWGRLIHKPLRTFRTLSALGPMDSVRVTCNLRNWSRRAGSASVYPAVQNLLLAARAHGLGATLTTWHSAFEQDFKSVLAIPRGVDIYALVPIGYPLGNFGSVRRRPVDELVDFEHWRGR